MEKISRIIAPNARTQSYDAKRAQPARPGAPQMGRPDDDIMMDRISISDKMLDPIMNGDTLTNAKAKISAPLTYEKPTENFKAQTIKEMTNQFFNKTNPKNVARDSSETHSEETLSRSQAAGSSVNPDSSSEVKL